jgi:putative addiction module component (TIGR02574 family)
MENRLELLEAEAMKLSANERAALVQLLLASLDEDDEIEDAWAIETERRIEEIESGTTPRSFLSLMHLHRCAQH